MPLVPPCRQVTHSHDRKLAGVALASLLAIFFALQWFLPLRTAVIVGADEGFELAKATLCLKGWHLYSQVWNDQPPLLTFLVALLLKHLSISVAAPRLLTGLFGAVLLASMFYIALRLCGLRAAVLATLYVLASPGFLLLASSCMLEVPSLAMGLAGLAVLVLLSDSARWPRAEILCGVLFGLAFEIKLISLTLLPLVGFVSVLQGRKNARFLRHVTISLLLVSFTLAATAVTTDLVTCQGAYLANFGTAWKSHFGPLKDSTHGSPTDYPFDWGAFLRNWDATIPALIGVVVSIRRALIDTLSLLPAFWLALALAIFASHRPWWHYYIVHTSAPLSLCAAMGCVWAFDFAHRQKNRWALGSVILFLLCATLWMGTRVYYQIIQIRRSPQTYSSLFLKEIARFKSRARWIYCEEPIYSFHAGIPMPPDLAVVMLKRYWSGEISDQRIAADLESFKPELILLRNNAAPRPYHSLIEADYRLIYMDNDHLLYVRADLTQTRRKIGPAPAR